MSTNFGVVGEMYDNQRTLVIRIMATTLAGDSVMYHSPRNFYKLIPLPICFCIFFVIFTGICCGHRFFCNSHALLGESRGYCTKTKQEWPDSGSTLENIFVNFTKLIIRRIFLYCKHFGDDGNLLRKFTHLRTRTVQTILWNVCVNFGLCGPGLTSRPQELTVRIRGGTSLK